MKPSMPPDTNPGETPRDDAPHTTPVRGGETPASADKVYGQTYWRSLAQRQLSHDESADGWKEFQPFVSVAATSGPRRLPIAGAAAHAEENPAEVGLDDLVPRDGVSRRRFFSVVGASAALAGATGCVRKPKETILAFGERPEDLIPGRPMFYASAIARGATVEGVLVESQDGRPTKIEGNPKHSGSQGATSVWTQASVLDMYDPERTRVPVTGGASSTMAQARGALADALTAAEANGGAGLGVLVRYVTSPTMRASLRDMATRFPQARVFVSDTLAPWNAYRAAELVGGPGTRTYHHLEKASIIFAADADFLGTEADSVRMAREWARTRRVVGPSDFMSRLYVAEPHLTSTGVMADQRRRIKASAVGDIMLALVAALRNSPEFKLPPAADLDGLPVPTLDADTQAFVAALAKDLGTQENRSKSAIIVGERQPVWVHVLGLMLDIGLGNQRFGPTSVQPAAAPAPGQDEASPPGGGSLRWRKDGTAVQGEDLGALASGLQDGSVSTLLCFEANPAYEATGELGMAAALRKATVFHFGHHYDETAKLAAWHIPVSHFLEGWGDVEAVDGTMSVQQPLINPLHETYSVTELLAFVATGTLLDGYSLLKSHWATEAGAQFSERIWRQWVHDGIVSGIQREANLPGQDGWADAAATLATRVAPIDGLEVDFHVDPKVLDGRMATNGWLQELPHPVTKLTWDNAAYVSKTTAEQWGLANGQMVTLTVDGRSAAVPVWIAPGQADDTVSVSLGYGRKATPVTEGAGFDVGPLRTLAAPWFAAGSATPAGGDEYLLASTQDYGSLKPPSHMGFEFEERPIVLERTRAEFQADQNFVEKSNLMPRSRLEHLWDPPKLTAKQQWGMSIDLNTCTGCNACVIACQAENNIPVVGKDQVSRGREMHWMRLDRYFRGDDDNPTAVVQPMACQHCEAAPCETVCPVAATVHSPDGLNEMTYNRCIGTRYCSNNCPYKVRRFNFHAYNLDVRPGGLWTDDPDGAWISQLQKNPDVTIRFRGVMEKCTYCVQRISEAKIEAHVAGRDLVDDGRILTACQQVCPTEAIIFGDIRDPDSKVSKAKRSPRDYEVLRDLNNHPRTSYLARIRNPHPDLAPPAPAKAAEAPAAHDKGHGQ